MLYLRDVGHYASDDSFFYSAIIAFYFEGWKKLIPVSLYRYTAIFTNE